MSEPQDPRDPALTPLSAIGHGEQLGQEGLVARGLAETEALTPAQVGQGVSDVLAVTAAEFARFKWEHYIKLGLGVLGAVLGAVFAILDPPLQPIAVAISSGSLLFTGGEVQAHVRAASRLVVGPPTPGST